MDDNTPKTPVIISLKSVPQDHQNLANDIKRHGAAQDKIITLALSDDSPETHKQLAKRRHDIKAAVRTLGFALAGIKSGYKFDDDKAAAKIDAIEKAINCLSRESDILVQVLASDT